MASYTNFIFPLENHEGFFERLKNILRQGRQDGIELEETPTQLRFISPTQACLLTFKHQTADWVKFEAQGLAKQCKDRQTRYHRNLAYQSRNVGRFRSATYPRNHTILRKSFYI